MNDTLTTIKNRRSIRKYKDILPTQEEINTLIDAGTSAPTSGNQQSWNFSVISNSNLIDEVSIAIKKIYAKMEHPGLRKLGLDESRHLFYHAPIVIVISGYVDAWNYVEDCSLAAGNIMLSATSLNIGSCWISGFPYLNKESNGELLDKLGIKDGYLPVCGITIGYIDGEYPKPHSIKENITTYIK
jgi:nitroreductase